MAETVQVTDTITRIRSEADIQEPQASSIATDAELLVWLNAAYRELFDLIAMSDEYFAKTATVTVSGSFALPSDFYRALGVDTTINGTVRTAQGFNFLERNDQRWSTVPKWRISNVAGVRSLIWRPTEATPTTDVTLWYIPTPSALASNGSFDAFNGWDDFVVRYVVREVRDKQEYDVSAISVKLAEARARVSNSAKRIRGYQDSIADTYRAHSYWYYNG